MDAPAGVIFVEAAGLRSIVLRAAGAPIASCVCVCVFFFRCRFFRVFFVPFPHSLRCCCCILVWRVRRTFFPSGWCFFYLVTTGWIFDISLCENSINQSIKESRRKVTLLFPEKQSLVLGRCERSGSTHRPLSETHTHDSPAKKKERWTCEIED